MHEHQGKEDLRGELLIVNGAFHTPFLGLGRARSWHVRPEISMVDALCGDQGQDEINHALQGVDPQERHVGFEVIGEFGTLRAGGF
ncbi:hypothetical protein GCM10008957_55370 [Deinococcus ruber]|uniref:Uncharacterized protein n=1 Tax=Deinococcus ruber TaxID=1848197 RepID=A0A918KXE3_9DEIO|nr:hypothetical protein GCM10008957_55370 [Deinococcus ruber]